jgi:acyl dehydratase
MKTTTAPFLYLEDLTVGQKYRAGSIDVTASDIIEYARRFDPQDFHTDPDKAKDTFFGELVASGWHTASMTMRMLYEAIPPMEGGMVGRQVEKMSWPRPVKPGDTLRLEVEVMSMRPSTGNPARGIMHTRNTTYNQNNEPVLIMDTIIMIPRKQGVNPAP